MCANLGEGFAKQRDSKKAFARYVSLSLGSGGEVRIWLQYASDLEYVDKAMVLELKERYLEISKMLRGLSLCLS